MRLYRGFFVLVAFTIAASVLMTGSVGATGVLDQEQWTSTSSISLTIDPAQAHKTLDQTVTAGMTGLLTNVEFYADVTSDRIYFYVNQSERGGPPLENMTFSTQLEQGSGVYNIDVSAAHIFLNAGDVFSIGLVGLGGTTEAGSFRAARDMSPDAYPAGALYWRYGGTGWMGLDYDDDMMFRTYVTPLDQEQWTYTSSIGLSIDPPLGHKTLDQSVTAGMTGLLTNVEFDAEVTSDRVYFYVNQGDRGGPPLENMTFSTQLEQGSGVYNIDVSAAHIFLNAGDVFSIGLVGLEGTTPAGSFKAARDMNPDAYPGGVLYWRYGGTGWMGLDYDDDMMFRTYVAPVEMSCFPQVGVGSGFNTSLILLNNGATVSTGYLTVTDEAGNPLSVSLAEAGSETNADGYRYTVAGPVTSLPFAVAPGATLFLRADALSPSDPVKVGWAHLEASGGSLGSIATYEFTQGGALKTTVGVSASQPVTAVTIPVDNDATRNRRTAFAVANYGAGNINIRIVVLDKNGTITNTITPPELNPLAPQTQVARFLDEFDASKGTFQGSMVLIAEDEKGFVATALVQSQGLYTSIPVIPGKAPNIP